MRKLALVLFVALLGLTSVSCTKHNLEDDLVVNDTVEKAVIHNCLSVDIKDIIIDNRVIGVLKSGETRGFTITKTNNRIGVRYTRCDNGKTISALVPYSKLEKVTVDNVYILKLEIW